MFFTQFGLLFSNMEWYILVCCICGFACLFVEIFQPGFGFFGITGIVLLGASIILRAIITKTGDNALLQAFQFLLFDALIVGFSIGFLFIAYKKGWLKKSRLFQSETAVDKDFSDGTANYSFLLGKDGEAATIMRPSGKILIDEKLYDAESLGFVIDKGSKVKVVKVEGCVIKVDIIQ